jgi:hypothetical protein
MASTPEQVEARLRDLKAVAEHYKEFEDFYYDVSVDLLGFVPTEMQMDIARYVAKGPLYAMVQAQRGEAKTTITGCYAVWTIIQDPKSRVLIFSAGTPLAKQISTWCICIINGMGILEPLRPDKSNPGTRTSVEAFDIHHDLKGADKSPSIACLGISSNMQGYRADLLIGDDIESAKNSMTQTMRENLRQLTRDFTSINQSGKILYLGTPQSVDSIYNDLPARGFTVRIWPGRFPTEEEEANYGGHLAPMIVKAMTADPSLRTGYGMDGDRGAATDPLMMSEEILVKKERDQGKAYFNLQFMLDTALTDADRFPLKLKHIPFYSLDREDAPTKYTWTNDPDFILPRAVGSPITDKLFMPAKTADTYLPYTYKVLAVDPAGGGQNGDETGCAVLYALNGMLFGMEVTGIPGGTEPSKLQQIVALAKKWEVTNILVEKNFGHGAYATALAAAFMHADYKVGIEEVWSTGQKELRIIDALEPVIGSHRLILNSSIPDEDVLSTNKYSTEVRPTYQLLHQMKFLTRERGSLIHDDRVEALAMAVRHTLHVLKQMKDHNELQKRETDKFRDFRLDPATGMWRFKHRVENDIIKPKIINIRDRFKR